jgi:membrane associated rhomboid family serine protease
MAAEDSTTTIVVHPSPTTTTENGNKRTLDYRDLYRHVPTYMLLMVLAYIGFYVATERTGGLISQSHVMEPLILDTLKTPTELWRLYSYSLLHGNLAHILNNSIMILTVGLFLNAAHGNARLMAVHTLGIIGGAFAVMWGVVRDPVSDRMLVVGASGGAYALIGAHAGNVLINWSEMPFRYFRLAMLALMATVDIVSYVVWYNANTSYACHLGGFATGMLTSPIFFINIRTLPWEVKLRWFCIAATTLGMAASLVQTLSLM